MKRRNILGKLKLELENSLPDSGEIIKNIKEATVEKDLAPVYDAINNVNNVKALTIKYNIMYISGIMFLTMLLFTLLLILLPVFNALLYPEKPIVTKFGIDINPSIDLMLDENDEVVWVLAKNKHAEILLSGENFVGKHVKDATDKIIKLAARAGYFSTSPEQELNITNAVLISAVSENTEKQQSLTPETLQRSPTTLVTMLVTSLVWVQTLPSLMLVLFFPHSPWRCSPSASNPTLKSFFCSRSCSVVSARLHPSFRC